MNLGFEVLSENDILEGVEKIDGRLIEIEW
jgi:hypothetical protein